ncbi:unnamed protein product, partial [Sphagnum jensenii]
KSNSVQAAAAASIAIAGKSSRACDGCGVQRAQWYCAADEAYLCDRCDTGVHSANSVACRHERVRLAPNGAPLKMPKRSSSAASSHHLSKPYKNKGVAKEAAAATGHRQAQATPLLPPPPLPTATGGGNLRVGGDAEGEDRFLVPNSFEDCCCLDSGVDGATVSLIGGGGNSEPSAVFIGGDIPGLVIDDFHGFDYGLNFDLAIRGEEDFDLRVGGGAAAAAASEDHGCFTSTTCSDGSGSSFSSGVDQQQSWDLENCIPPTPSPFARFFSSSRVKTEEEEDVTKQTLQGPAEKLKKKAKEILKCSLEGLSEEDLRHVPSLRLDYEEVLNAWSDRGALWTDDDDLSGSQTVPGGEDSFNSDDASLSNEGREARVLRYKEKRRTRLFSKKIRYEVRKLNAERRPRMKGRFVKRIQLPSR